MKNNKNIKLIKPNQKYLPTMPATADATKTALCPPARRPRSGTECIRKTTTAKIGWHNCTVLPTSPVRFCGRRDDVTVLLGCWSRPLRRSSWGSWNRRRTTKQSAMGKSRSCGSQTPPESKVIKQSQPAYTDRYTTTFIPWKENTGTAALIVCTLIPEPDM